MSLIILYTWTECTDNNAGQTLVSGQVASLHVLQKSCGNSRARWNILEKLTRIIKF